MREYDARFARMETALQKDLQNLRKEMNERWDSFQSHFKRELADLRSAVSSEVGERSAALKQLSEDLAQSSDASGQRLEGLSDSLDRRTSELREEILKESHSLSEAFSERSEGLSSEFAQMTRELEETKLNRGAFAGFLMELAVRVSGENPEDVGADDGS